MPKITDEELAALTLKQIKEERAQTAKRLGASWRIQAGGQEKQALIRLESTNFGYPAPVFDELCIDDWFHLEQMGPRDWYLGLFVNTADNDSAIQLNLHVNKDGTLDVMQYGGPDIREGRGK